MKIEIRYTKDPEGGETKPRGAVIISESEEESEVLDQIFGNEVINKDGLIGVRTCECRLSDGFGEHYVYIKGDT